MRKLLHPFRKVVKDILLSIPKALDFLTRLLENKVKRFYTWKGGTGYGLLELLFWPTVSPWYRYSKALSMLNLRSGISILEIGVSSLNITKFISVKRIFYVPLDIDKQRINIFKKRANPVLADVSKLPLRNDSFDCIISLASIDLVSKRKRRNVLLEFKRVAKQRIIVETIVQDHKRGFMGEAFDKYVKENYESHGRSVPRWVKGHMKVGYPKVKEFLSIFPKARIFGYRMPLEFITFKVKPLSRSICGIKYWFSKKDLFSAPPFTNAIFICDLRNRSNCEVGSGI